MSLSEVAVDDVIDLEEEPMVEEDGSEPQVYSLVCAILLLIVDLFHM